jgi:hypothetical protein
MRDVCDKVSVCGSDVQRETRRVKEDCAYNRIPHGVDQHLRVTCPRYVFMRPDIRPTSFPSALKESLPPSRSILLVMQTQDATPRKHSANTKRYVFFLLGSASLPVHAARALSPTRPFEATTTRKKLTSSPTLMVLPPHPGRRTLSPGFTDTGWTTPSCERRCWVLGVHVSVQRRERGTEDVPCWVHLDRRR